MAPHQSQAVSAPIIWGWWPHFQWGLPVLLQRVDSGPPSFPPDFLQPVNAHTIPRTNWITADLQETQENPKRYESEVGATKNQPEDVALPTIDTSAWSGTNVSCHF